MTLKQHAEAQLNALMEARGNNMLTVSIGGRSVTYREMADLSMAINYWARIVASFNRVAVGLDPHGISIARFGIRG